MYLNRKILSPFPLIITVLILTASCDSDPARSDVDPGPGNNNGFSHTENPGASAEAFLRDDDFTELLVEVQYMPGFEPTENALEELRVFLETHLNKTGVTFTEPEEIPSGGQELYSASDIRELESEHRSHFTDGNTLASYNLFVDGAYTEGNVLGIAYYNTSTAYFGETIRSASGSPPLSPSRSNIEGTVLRHEYGHLIGLVNNGVNMQEEHQENGPHCSEDDCVMYFSVNTTDFFANIFDGSIPDLDDYCEADISAIKN